MPVEIQILILAAGKGHRMGSTKQLLPYMDQTLLGAVIDVANSLSLGKPLVVLGYEADRIMSSLGDVQADFVLNPNWHQGMGNTLAFAVDNALTNNLELQGVLVMLADQPKISKTHLLQLVHLHQQNKYPIIATEYPNGGGVPAIFDKSVFSDLIKLEGEQGARQLIRNHAAAGLLVPGVEEVWDIDTPDDYQRLVDKKQ